MTAFLLNKSSDREVNIFTAFSSSDFIKEHIAFLAGSYKTDVYILRFSLYNRSIKPTCLYPDANLSAVT